METTDTKQRPALDTKWGDAIAGGLNGYQIFPDALVRHQKRLGLDATDMVVLLNICMHWWETEPDKWPHPRAVTIANRMGTTTRTVERHIERLAGLGLLKWLPTQRRAGGLGVRPFDLSGLVAKLRELVSTAKLNEARAA